MKAQTNSGFTLLEVLIVTLFLVFLAFSTFQAVRSTVGTKEEIDQKTEALQESRAVVALLDRDIRSATMITQEDLIWEPLTPKPDEPPLPPIPPPVTIFKGEAQRLFFSSRSHQRMSSDIPENEQHFVTYQLSEGDLIRAESPRAVAVKDREDPKKFKQFTVLTQVKKLEFTYWDEKSEKWIDRWDSEVADTLDRLPPAVKISIEYMPDVKAGRKKVKMAQLQTSVRILENVFKSPAKKASPPSAPTSPVPSGGSSE